MGKSQWRHVVKEKTHKERGQVEGRKHLGFLEKTHKERGQVEGRKHLGFLEKKKDYQKRSASYKAKQKELKKLREQAALRNPDEYYREMVELEKEKQSKYTKEQLEEFKSQDFNYMLYKQKAEKTKIEKLKETIQAFDGTPINKHTVFVDSEKELKEFDPVEHFQTVPEAVNRTFNRPKKEQLERGEIFISDVGKRGKKVEKEREKKYKELLQRMDRETTISGIVERVELEKKLGSSEKKVMVKKATGQAAAVYKWERVRKR
eukprot:TRINITY_DN3858_c0_g1_i5.p1 TRINITY_DN3858_c0_g1~~TRINITY_DN3858_c0_g1_i5.p1  ORF type:complete len:262 (+),score=103.86 TRINITY_DN3858_c0_g1_i5:92-877(+)